MCPVGQRGNVGTNAVTIDAGSGTILYGGNPPNVTQTVTGIGSVTPE